MRRSAGNGKKCGFAMRPFIVRNRVCVLSWSRAAQHYCQRTFLAAAVIEDIEKSAESYRVLVDPDGSGLWLSVVRLFGGEDFLLGRSLVAALIGGPYVNDCTAIPLASRKGGRALLEGDGGRNSSKSRKTRSGRSGEGVYYERRSDSGRLPKFRGPVSYALYRPSSEFKKTAEKFLDDDGPS